MKYLKYFEEVSAYEAYKNGSDYVLPNVSYIEETKGVSYEPYVEPPFKMIDLGLPSGRLWCDRNVGAASPEESGLYFQWGDTVGYTVEQMVAGEKKFDSNWSDYFDTENGYVFNKYNFDDGFTVLQPEDDAVTVNMGVEYRMPTEKDFNELINNTTCTYIDLDGNEFSGYEVQHNAIKDGNLKGVKLTSNNNSNSIFIHCSGYCQDSNFYDAGSYGYIPSSNLFSATQTNFMKAWQFDYRFSSEGVGILDRFIGLPVRGVK